MVQLVTWLTGVVTGAATPLAGLLLIFGAAAGAIAFLSGGSKSAMPWWIGGAVSCGVLLFLNSIVAFINAVPKPA